MNKAAIRVLQLVHTKLKGLLSIQLKIKEMIDRCALLCADISFQAHGEVLIIPFAALPNF